jgi:parvulin-like peptidyl-prolyl isomerase
MNLHAPATVLFWLSLAFPVLAEEPLARAGEAVFTLDDLRNTVLALDEPRRASLSADPGLLEQVVRASLAQRLLLDEARTHGWDQQPQVIAQAERARLGAITESWLEHRCAAPADYPTDADIQEAYEREKQVLRVPPSWRLAQIFIAKGDDAEKQVSNLKEQLQVPKADFAALAQQHSQEPVSASRGGEIGWVTEIQIEPGLREAVAGLKLAEVSPPILLKDGWHFIKLLDARAAHVPTLVQARPQLIRQLRQEKLRTQAQAHLAALLREHPPALDKDALARALSSLATSSADKP